MCPNDLALLLEAERGRLMANARRRLVAGVVVLSGAVITHGRQSGLVVSRRGSASANGRVSSSSRFLFAGSAAFNEPVPYRSISGSRGSVRGDWSHLNVSFGSVRQLANGPVY
jgi:hypothetical protein